MNPSPAHQTLPLVTERLRVRLWTRRNRAAFRRTNAHDTPRHEVLPVHTLRSRKRRTPWPEFRHVRRSTALRSGPWKTKPPEASPGSPGLRGWPLTRRSRPAWKWAGVCLPDLLGHGVRPRSRPQRDGLRLQGSGTPRGGGLHHGKQPAVTGPHAAARDAPQSRRGFRSSRAAARITRSIAMYSTGC